MELANLLINSFFKHNKGLILIVCILILQGSNSSFIVLSKNYPLQIGLDGLNKQKRVSAWDDASVKGDKSSFLSLPSTEMSTPMTMEVQKQM